MSLSQKQFLFQYPELVGIAHELAESRGKGLVLEKALYAAFLVGEMAGKREAVELLRPLARLVKRTG